MDVRDAPLSSDAERMSARLERIKRLCADLSVAQSDARKYDEVMEEIRRETDAFNSSRATHDH